MEEFDSCLREVREYVERKKRQGRLFREFVRREDYDQLLTGLPIKVGEGAGAKILLREDTLVELGNPGVGGCAFVLWSQDHSSVRNGQITLIGPCIQEAAGKSLPFGQVLILGGGRQRPDYSELDRIPFVVSGQIEGYMIRSVRGRMWTRVSIEAWERGFSFEILGKVLIAMIKSRFPFAEAVEVLYVTSSKEDVEELEAVGKEVEKITRWFKKMKRVEEGVYECPTYSCDDCEEKVVCDTIREVRVLRKRSLARGEA